MPIPEQSLFNKAAAIAFTREGGREGAGVEGGREEGRAPAIREGQWAVAGLPWAAGGRPRPREATAVPAVSDGKQSWGAVGALVESGKPLPTPRLSQCATAARRRRRGLHARGILSESAGGPVRPRGRAAAIWPRCPTAAPSTGCGAHTARTPGRAPLTRSPASVDSDGLAGRPGQRAANGTRSAHCAPRTKAVLVPLRAEQPAAAIRASSAPRGPKLTRIGAARTRPRPRTTARAGQASPPRELPWSGRSALGPRLRPIKTTRTRTRTRTRTQAQTMRSRPPSARESDRRRRARPQRRGPSEIRSRPHQRACASPRSGEAERGGGEAGRHEARAASSMASAPAARGGARPGPAPGRRRSAGGAYAALTGARKGPRAGEPAPRRARPSSPPPRRRRPPAPPRRRRRRRRGPRPRPPRPAPSTAAGR